MATPGSEPGVTGAGHVYVDQGIEEPDALAPEAKQLLVAGLLGSELGDLEPAIQLRDPILQLLGDPSGASVQYPAFRVVLTQRVLQRLGSLHDLVDLVWIGTLERSRTVHHRHCQGHRGSRRQAGK